MSIFHKMHDEFITLECQVRALMAENDRLKSENKTLEEKASKMDVEWLVSMIRTGNEMRKMIGDHYWTLEWDRLKGYKQLP